MCVLVIISLCPTLCFLSVLHGENRRYKMEGYYAVEIKYLSMLTESEGLMADWWTYPTTIRSNTY